jgi:transcriptional regulator with XRE-family HTH domain
VSAEHSVETTLGTAVHRLREARQLSLRALAERTGFSASFLSQVEHGQASPSIGSMERIASALGVTLSQFFALTAPDDAAGTVTRAGSRPGLGSEWSRAHLEALAAHRPSARLVPVLVTLEPGGRSGRDPRPADHEEFALVLEGDAVLTLGEERHALAVGDAATIPAGTPRLWENVAARPTRFVLVEAIADVPPARAPRLPATR